MILCDKDRIYKISAVYTTIKVEGVLYYSVNNIPNNNYQKMILKFITIFIVIVLILIIMIIIMIDLLIDNSRNNNRNNYNVK